MWFVSENLTCGVHYDVHLANLCHLLPGQAYITITFISYLYYWLQVYTFDPSRHCPELFVLVTIVFLCLLYQMTQFHRKIPSGWLVHQPSTPNQHHCNHHHIYTIQQTEFCLSSKSIGSNRLFVLVGQWEDKQHKPLK